MSLAGVRLEVIEGYEEYVAGDADAIDGIRISEDGRTVHITTHGAYAPLPELLASPIFGIVPRALVRPDDAVDPEEAEADFFRAPIGSGPVRLAGEDADTEAARSRPDGADDVLVMVPAEDVELGFDEVQLVHFPEVEQSYAAFQEGEVDWTQVPSEEVDAAADEYGDEAISPFHAEFFYGINVGDPTYESEEFRRAIVQAIDRQAIVEESFPTGVPLNGTVVEGVPGFQENACGEFCAYDPDAAEALLEEEFGDDDPPTVRLDFYEGERERHVAQRIADDLGEVGIEAELRPHDPADYETFVTGGDQEVFLFGWVGIAPTADSYLAPLFLTGSPDNVTAYGTTVIDASIAAARQFPTIEERAEAYQSVEEVIMAAVPVIPLVQVKTLSVVSERVVGWSPQLDGTFVISEVELES
jgi:peptide/nickel transport system substrate-binding protein/oligopeptide transport system substrate-binding protein